MMRISPRSLMLLLALTGLAPAQIINIDFNGVAHPATYSGLAASPDPAGSDAVWNGLARQGWSDELSASDLLDSSGNATSVSLVLGLNGGFVSSPGDQELGVGLYSGLMADYIFISSAAANLVTTSNGLIAGLVPEESYNIYFYSQGDTFATPGSKGQNGLFTINGVSKQTGWDGVVGGDGLLLEGVEYVVFTTSADLSGKINFSWSNVVPGSGGNVITDSDGNTSIYSALNGIQIVPTALVIPEPPVALLGGIALIVLLGRRR